MLLNRFPFWKLTSSTFLTQACTLTMQRAPAHGKRARRAAPRPFPLSRGLPALHFTPENEKQVLPVWGLADLMGRPNLVQPVVVDNIRHGLKTVQNINENKSESISSESFMSHAILSTRFNVRSPQETWSGLGVRIIIISLQRQVVQAPKGEVTCPRPLWE